MALTKVTSGVRTIASSEVVTASIADDAVTAAKLADDSVGLPALAPQTDGSIISYDASTNPVLISPGTTGHVLTSAGAGAVPAFASPAASTLYRAGEIIENLELTCTGQAQTVLSGAYTPQNVTGVQNLTSTYADVTGSTLAYTPPAGTTRVVFTFGCQVSYKDTNAISHWKLFLDSDEVTAFRRSASASIGEIFHSLSWIFTIGGSAVTATGVVESWGSAKTIKLQSREFGSSNEAELHTTTNFDGGASAIVVPPTISIKAIK